MKNLQLDLQTYINSFLDRSSDTSDSHALEVFLAGIPKETQSMHDFLEALVSANLWQGWHIEPNPYKSMIVTIGSEIDRLATLREEPAFHSKWHMMDVCLMLSYLLGHEESPQGGQVGQPWSTTSTEKWQLLLAAAAHDLGHPGLINTVPFQLEQESLALFRALLIRADIDSRSINTMLETITPWILATDHGQYNALLERLAQHPPRHVDCLAMLLVEADLASSVLPFWGKILTERLCEEWARPYPEKSIALKNQTGYLGFLRSLKFVSPQSARAGIPQILNNSLIKLRSQLP